MSTQHKAPCRQCPFRRKAAPGWLGGYTPDEFRQLADQEARMPCHLHMGGNGATYASPGNAPQCAGRAIYWANQLKQPRLPGALLELPANTKAVFNWPHEFVAHHAAGPLAESRK